MSWRQQARYAQKDALVDISPDLDAYVANFMRAMQDAPPKFAKSVVRSAVNRVTKPFKERISSNAPFLKGNLKSNVKSQTRFGKNKFYFSAQVGYDKRKSPHALLMEEGTKRRKTRGDTQDRFGMSYKQPANRGRIIPRRFLAGVYREMSRQMSVSMAEELKKSWERAVKRSLKKANVRKGLL